MELSNIWTCSCGTENVGDVFTGTCWKCGDAWVAKPGIVDAAEARVCPDCGASDGFHTLRCPTHPTPGIEPVPKKFKD